MEKEKFSVVDLHHRPGDALPASDAIFYQCLRCWDVVPSVSENSLYCSCRNISVDVDAGRGGE